MAQLNKKVALIEDEADLAEIYNLKLVMEGVSTVVISDSTKALDVLLAEKPSLILLDVMMPEVDGFELFRLIRAEKALNSIKIYIWSNLTQKKDLDRAKEMKVDGYLIKSDYTPATLAIKVKELLEKI